MRKISHLQSDKCPVCRAILNAASGINNSGAPVEGDLTICVYCGTILVYGDKMKLRVATTPEMENIKAEEPSTYRSLIAISLAVMARMRPEGTA